MFNRPLLTWSEEASTKANGWGVDRDPQIRLVILGVIFLLPVLVVGVRVAHLQLGLNDSFSSAFSLTNETFEEIPARDGRIFAADGSLLAGDVHRIDIAVYYPAIQDPPDDVWIAGKAKPRLSKSDRRNKQKVADEKQKVILENENLWSKLAALTDRPLNEVLESRRKEQARIELIKESVQRRFRERQAEKAAAAARQAAADGSSWLGVFMRLRQTMAEPSERSRGPRVITEELDYCTIITDVGVDVKEEIEAHPNLYPYTRIVVQSRRTYPRGELASHLIGHRRPLSSEDLQQRHSAYPDGDPQDYRVGDLCGLSGLERSYDAHLKGARGQRAIVKNRRGEIVEIREIRQPRHGRDLETTIDPKVQLQADQILDAALEKVTEPNAVDPEATPGKRREPTCPQGGCIVALDVQTGAIIAASSAPRFDLNLLVDPDSNRWADLKDDPRSPFLSRATQMALPPGSVFKVISAVAAMESGKLRPDAMFHCHGYLDRPDQPHRCLTFRHFGYGHGDVNLAEALCRSCNVYFYTAARHMGPQPIVDWAGQFGIGQLTGVDLPSEASGNLPTPDATLGRGRQRHAWKPSDTLGLAIGQSELTVTPLQMARAMAAIANGGHLVTPHLAANFGPTSISDSDLNRRSFPPVESRPISGLHRDTLDRVREGLVMVVHDPKGTAYKTARMKEVTIAGKTGTAETNGADHAWFAGYVPAERPRIAFVVVLEHGGSGGKAAGPVAKEFVKALIDADLILKTTQMISENKR